AKIDAQGDGIDVQEDGLRPEVTLQPVVEPPSHIGTVVTTIGDEELGHLSRPWSLSRRRPTFLTKEVPSYLDFGVRIPNPRPRGWGFAGSRGRSASPRYHRVPGRSRRSSDPSCEH